MSEKEQVPVQEKRNSADSLENFAIQIEEMFRKGKDQGPMALKRQVCRLLASTDQKVSAVMTAKWVEWRYGKAKETHEHKVQVELSIGDADRIIAGYFIAAAGGTYSASEGDTGQAQEQDRKLLSV